MTIALEQLGDGSTADRNFQRLMSLVLDTGGLTLGFRIGRQTLTWSGTTASATATVTHGLGGTPSEVFYGEVTDLGTSWWKAMTVSGSFTDTTFQVKGRTFDGTTPTGTGTCFWLAIG